MVWGDWRLTKTTSSVMTWTELSGRLTGESGVWLHYLSTKWFGGQTHSHHFIGMLFLTTAALRTSANIIYVQTACRESTKRSKYVTKAKLLLCRSRRRLNQGLLPWIICKTNINSFFFQLFQPYLLQIHLFANKHFGHLEPVLWQIYLELPSNSYFLNWNTLMHTLRHVGSGALTLAAQPPVLLFSSHPLISL